MQTEVKTTALFGWHLRESQIAGSSLFFLVSLNDAKVWVLTRAEIQALVVGGHRVAPDVVMLPKSRLPNDALDAYGKISALARHSLQNQAAPRPAPISADEFTGETRSVRRALATGEVREYLYCRKTGARVVS